VRDLLFDVNDCLTRKLAICVTYEVNDVSALSELSRFSKLLILFLNDLVDGDLCSFFDFHIFLFF